MGGVLFASVNLTINFNTLSVALKFSVDHVTAARMLKANWFATQTGKQWKTMNYYCLKERIRKGLSSSSYRHRKSYKEVLDTCHE